MRIMVTITPICSTAISEDIVQNINKSFPLCTTCLSPTNSLVYRAAKLCNEEKTAAFERFAIKYDGYFYNIRKNCPLKRLLLFLGNSNAITLYYRIGIGGGLGLGEEKGIRYFFYSNESAHTPHVHAKYQGRTVSIDLQTLKVKGSFKSKKKEFEAVQHIRANQAEYIKKFALYTNVLRVTARKHLFLLSILILHGWEEHYGAHMQKLRSGTPREFFTSAAAN